MSDFIRKASFGARLLPRTFYIRPPEVVARALLGKLLVHYRNGEQLAGRIVEVEAYQGLSDPASHAAIGKTAYNAVLFGPPGFTDVYLIYGMHYCLNISCLPDGDPGAVLIRALEPIVGLATMAQLRGLSAGISPKMLTSGPGRLCQALGITRAMHHDLDVMLASSSLQVLDDGYLPGAITRTPRIGIRKATDRMLRFIISGNPYLSPTR